ncbi:hypothetical protein VTJ04DRAFT_4688 [Mycothermus thermophilus]|uniref:uncharacterized protein n=1 Tax=Humicola insolens TaxID=85995 RepID=UPI0037441E1C
MIKAEDRHPDRYLNRNLRYLISAPKVSSSHSITSCTSNTSPRTSTPPTCKHVQPPLHASPLIKKHKVQARHLLQPSSYFLLEFPAEKALP